MTFATLVGDRLLHGGRETPQVWLERKLKEITWSKQDEILESLLVNRKTAVKSCHGVGKSHVASRVAAWWLDTNPVGEAFVVSTAPTFPQVRAILWRYIGQAHRKGKLRGRCNQTEWHIGDEIVGYGRKPSDYDEDAFQGIHSAKVLVIVDEACGIPTQLWVAIDSLVTNEDCRILAIGNPDDPTSQFAKNCQPGSGWHVITISAFDSPNFTDEDVPPKLARALVGRTWVEDAERNWGVESPLYISKVLGEFPEDATDGIVPASGVARLRVADQPDEEGDDADVQLGVDVGAGGDQSVIRERRGNRAGRVWRSRHDDPELLAAEVVHAIRETGARRVAIDMIGWGWGTVGHVRSLARAANLDVDVIGVNVGERSTQPKRFANCLVAETLVRPLGELRAAYRMRYDGPLVRVKTAAGDDFTGTPNHQVLTPGGWVSIQNLNVGDHLIHPSNVETVGGRNPEVDQVPAAIGEVYRSLLHAGVAERVPGSRVDFHGDRPTGDVNVVAVNRDLSAIWPAIREQSKDRPLVRRLHRLASFTRQGSAREPLGGRGRDVQDRLRPVKLASFRPLLTLSRGFPDKLKSLLRRPERDTRLQEHPLHDAYTDVEIAAQFIHRLAGDVPVDDSLSLDGIHRLREHERHRVGSVSHLDATLSQDSGDLLVVDTVRSSDGPGGLADGVPLDHVIDVEFIAHSSSEVYTLQTTMGMYTTGNCIHKNCKAELWWVLGREATMEGTWDLHEIDDQTAADLTAPKYSLTAKGRIQVETKDEVRARLGRSPDDADALLLAFYKGAGRAVIHKSSNLSTTIRGGSPGRATIGPRT